jgi:hypothetical protein
MVYNEYQKTINRLQQFLPYYIRLTACPFRSCCCARRIIRIPTTSREASFFTTMHRLNRSSYTASKRRSNAAYVAMKPFPRFLHSVLHILPYLLSSHSSQITVDPIDSSQHAHLRMSKELQNETQILPSLPFSSLYQLYAYNNPSVASSIFLM